jgi:hypothetical protein
MLVAVANMAGSFCIQNLAWMRRKMRQPKTKPLPHSPYENEMSLVADIRDYLAMRQAVTVRVNAGMKVIKSEQPGGRDRVFRGAEKGTSDILACIGGRFVAIEAKMQGHKTTPAQDAFLESVREAGGVAIVAYSLDDVDAGLGWAKYR